MSYIDTSIFDLFKIGPGPSSSHTIGPMKAGYDFLTLINHRKNNSCLGADRIEVHLYGSLSLTGKGHGTDKAIVAGLLGATPESCDPYFIKKLLNRKNSVHKVKLGDKTIHFRPENIHFSGSKHSFPYENTMVISLYSGRKKLMEKEYYSIGGGFIKIKGQKKIKPPHPKYLYSNMAELKRVMQKNKIGLNRLVLENEKTISGFSEIEIFRRLQNIIDTMAASVEQGLKSKGFLPGPIHLQRKANSLFNKVAKNKHAIDKFLVYLNAYAIAAAEENAAGSLVVTAPTSGSAGVIPGLIYLLIKQFKISKKKIAEGLMAAAVIGFIAKHNASISGAEVGCQGEIGVASAMGAALLAHINLFPMKIIENAAEIALEHQLGMTCDPVGGYVQIPCIERNAVGAIHAYNAYLLATSGDAEKQKLEFDEVIEAMLDTGRNMSSKYKETSQGGLAVCSISC